MYHAWFWSWRTDYADNVSYCDFGEYYVSFESAIRRQQPKWHAICMKHTTIHVSKWRWQAKQQMNNIKKFLVFSLDEGFINWEPLFEMWAWSWRRCKNSVCSLTSAINFKNENFCPCFLFDLFYLYPKHVMKMKPTATEKWTEQKKNRNLLQKRKQNLNRNFKPTTTDLSPTQPCAWCSLFFAG